MSETNIITIDTNGPTVDFPKYWEKCIGSGHAALGLRADWQEHLKFIHDQLGFEYVRFHGLFNDDMKVVVALREVFGIGSNKVLTFSFYQIDQLFDYILSIGMKPFIELSFMPKALASGKRTVFYYKGNITPPKDYKKWADLMIRFTNHLIDRYGLEEVKTWFFEVWNEPNLFVFWKGKQKDYFKLYETTVRAIKSVNEDLQVGGPATAGNAWITDIIEFSKEKEIPLDFIATHQYPSHEGLGHALTQTITRFIKATKKAKRKVHI